MYLYITKIHCYSSRIATRLPSGQSIYNWLKRYRVKYGILSIEMKKVFLFPNSIAIVSWLHCRMLTSRSKLVTILMHLFSLWSSAVLSRLVDEWTESLWGVTESRYFMNFFFLSWGGLSSLGFGAILGILARARVCGCFYLFISFFVAFQPCGPSWKFALGEWQDIMTWI